MTRRARTTNAERRTTVEERRAAKRQEILDAAVRAIRADGAKVSMSRIASEAGTSKPIVYRLFRDKEGLYQALAERYVQRLIDRLRSALVSDTNPRQLVVATIDAYLGFLEEEAQVHRFLAQRMLPYREDGQPVLAHFQAQRGSGADRGPSGPTQDPRAGHGGGRSVGVRIGGDGHLGRRLVDRPPRGHAAAPRRRSVHLGVGGFRRSGRPSESGWPVGAVERAFGREGGRSMEGTRDMTNTDERHDSQASDPLERQTNSSASW